MENFDFMYYLENVRAGPTWKSRAESTGGSDPISIRCSTIPTTSRCYYIPERCTFRCIIAPGSSRCTCRCDHVNTFNSTKNF